MAVLSRANAAYLSCEVVAEKTFSAVRDLKEIPLKTTRTLP